MEKFKKWFEKEFNLKLPEWMFPNLVERLRGTPARVKDRADLIPVNILTRRFENEWSIQENIGHLLDLETLWAGRLDDFESGKEVLRSADLENKKTHGADHNKSAISDILFMFREARYDFVRRIESYDEELILRTCLHPRLNRPMNMLDLMFFIAEHDDHHLAMITRILKLV
jgi:uncharacterized damage-inducible protein DinB